MECIGAQNVATMVVSKCLAKGSSRRKRLPGGSASKHVFHHLYRNSSMVMQIRCGSTSTSRESYVAVKEDFADQEDYIKAGGSELLYVQMQQNKQMKQQSKFSDKVHLSLNFHSLLLLIKFYDLFSVIWGH